MKNCNFILILLFLFTFCLAAQNSKTYKILLSHDISAHSNTEILAYPNPFKDVEFVEIAAVNTPPTSLKIYDIIGVERMSVDLADFSAQVPQKIQIKDLPEGVYFCNVYSNDKLLGSKKIICIK
jgi:hypothetical protein